MPQPTAGRGSTIAIEGTALGEVRSIGLFTRTMSTTDTTLIGSTAERRAAELDSWNPITVEAWWLKTDAAQGTLQAARDNGATVTVLITNGDGSTQTAECWVTRFDRGQADRRNRLPLTIELTPEEDVTESDGV